MSFASALRNDLAERARRYAVAEALPHCVGYGETPTVCFVPDEDNAGHGNFLQRSYKAILLNPAWKKRLGKVHGQGRRILPRNVRERWMELDSCTSSDALLMNIFCHPGVSRDGRVSALLGSEPGMAPCFGYKARVPLANGRFDRTDWGTYCSRQNSPRTIFRLPRKTFSSHIVTSWRCSIAGNCRRRSAAISPTSYSEMCWRPTLCNVRSAFWSMPEGRIS